MGDLNVRTGNKGNIHKRKLNEHLNHILPTIDDASKLTKRCSNNLKTKTSGNTSTKLCNNHNLWIANRKTPGDRKGNFTWCQRSRICFSKIPIYGYVAQFKVLSQESDSKYASIATLFKTSGLSIEKEKIPSLRKVYK